MHGFLGPPPECDSGGVGGGLGTCILMQWLGRSLNQHFNEWTPTDHLPKVEWPRSDKIWPGRLCSLYHLMLLEIKREGKNQRQSQLLVLCWTKDSFIHLSPPPPPFSSCFSCTEFLIVPDHAWLFLSSCFCAYCSFSLEFLCPAFFSLLKSLLH